jgi:hypothetical protein
MTAHEPKGPPGPEDGGSAGPTTGAPLTESSASHHTTNALAADSIARSAPIVTVAWRYKDAAKEQARRGLITWKTYREYCAEVDRIKRQRLRAAEDAARIHSDAVVETDNQLAATAALMRQRHTGNVKDTHVDQERKSREMARAELATSLCNAPELSDREHARRVGVDHKTVGAMRRRLQESREIPHFLWRADPRTGKLSQPSHRPARRTATLTAKAVI